MGKFNVDANGQIMASTGCIRTQTFTKANGKSSAMFGKNINLGANGQIMASTGVIRTEIATNEIGEEIRKNRLENLKIDDNGKQYT